MEKVFRVDEFIDDELMVLTFKIQSQNSNWCDVFRKLNAAAIKSVNKEITDMESFLGGEYIGYLNVSMEEYEKLVTKA